MAVSQAQSELGLKERFYRDFQTEVTGMSYDSNLRPIADQISVAGAN
jgi:hypothetical protein